MTTLMVALCIVLIAALLGKRAAGAYSNRAEVLAKLKSDVEALRTQMIFTRCPLPQAVRKQSEAASPETAPLWQVLHAGLQRHDGAGLSAHFAAALEEAGKGISWRGVHQEDTAQFSALATVLAQEDMGALSRAFDGWLAPWQARCEEAASIQKSKGSMVQKLYVIAGIAVGIFCL